MINCANWQSYCPNQKRTIDGTPQNASKDVICRDITWLQMSTTTLISLVRYRPGVYGQVGVTAGFLWREWNKKLFNAHGSSIHRSFPTFAYQTSAVRFRPKINSMWQTAGCGFSRYLRGSQVLHDDTIRTVPTKKNSKSTTRKLKMLLIFK
ncbi:hypothetical protein O9929_16955 [Vibrio lentus]|nr:hypothetical protein [Vibrio lentus]